MSRKALRYFDDDEWELYYYKDANKPVTHLTYQQRRLKTLMSGPSKAVYGYDNLDTEMTTRKEVRDEGNNLVSLVERNMSPHKDWTLRIKETGELWHRTTKVAEVINGEYLYNDDGTRKHDIVVNVHHRKENKKLSIESLMKVANRLNSGDHIKYLKKPLRGYVSQELYDRLINYYKYEDPENKAMRSSEIDVLAMNALTKILSNIVDQTQRRQAFSPESENELSKTRQHEINELRDNLPREINVNRKQLVVKDIMDVVIKNDRKRNETIKKRIKSEIRKADRTYKAKEEFRRYEASAYGNAFSKLVGLIQGGTEYEDHKALKYVSRKDGRVNLDGLIKYAQELGNKIHNDLNERARELYGVNNRDRSNDGD